MRKSWLVIALVVLAASGGVACLLWPGSTDPGGSEPGAEEVPVEPSMPFVRQHDERSHADAGVGEVTGVVLDEAGAPVAGALVQLLAHEPELDSLLCGECHDSVLSCTAPATAQQVLAGIRAGSLKPPPVIAETRSGPEGQFTFAAAPLSGVVVAVHGERQGDTPLEGDVDVAVTLRKAESAALTVVDQAGEALRGALITLYSPLSGGVREYTTDAEGKATIAFFDHRSWLVGESPGHLPSGLRPTSENHLTLSEPRTLVVRTRVGGQLVDADVMISGHGDPRKHRARGGVLQLDGLPVGMLTLSAQAGEFASAEQSVELYEPRTEFDFELRRGGKLYITAVSELGEPLDAVSAVLSGFESAASADAVNGAVIALGPVPEGEYTVHVTSDRRVTVVRQLDLKPGDNTLEVTMRTAPRIAGVVVDAEGKPVQGARVSVSEGERETAVGLSDEAGAFDVELEFAGEVTVRGHHPSSGEASVLVKSPAEGVKLQLAERAVLEVELTDFDGTRATGELSVRSPEQPLMRWVEVPESGPARIAGLPSGKYVLEKFVPERVPLVKELELVEGRVTRVSLRLERGLTLTGSAVDHEGAPLSNVVVTVQGRRETSITGPDGRFTWSGLVAGPTQLHAGRQNGQSASLNVTIPARDVVLRFEKVGRVRGRVIDERGAVVREFDLNGSKVNAPDGRFDVEAPTGMIDLYAAGYTPLFLDAVKADLGDVVLKRLAEIEGVVVDGDGKPVGGASVIAEGDGVPVVTDAAGRFKVSSSLETPVGLVATRGALSGRATAAPGARDVRLSLLPGTRVVGRVLVPPGRSAATLVRAHHVVEGARAVEIDTDDAGRFELELAQGTWSFSVRGAALDRLIEVRGARQEVVLGDDGSGCGLVASSTGVISQVVLLPPSHLTAELDWTVLTTTPGSIVVPVWQLGRQVAGTGVPCGRYTLMAVVDGSIVRQPLDLRAPGQPVALVAPPEEPPETDQPGAPIVPIPELFRHH